MVVIVLVMVLMVVLVGVVLVSFESDGEALIYSRVISF